MTHDPRCERCSKVLTESDKKALPKGTQTMMKFGVTGSYPVWCLKCKRADKKKKDSKKK